MEFLLISLVVLAAAGYCAAVSKPTTPLKWRLLQHYYEHRSPDVCGTCMTHWRNETRREWTADDSRMLAQVRLQEEVAALSDDELNKWVWCVDHRAAIVSLDPSVCLSARDDEHCAAVRLRDLRPSELEALSASTHG